MNKMRRREKLCFDINVEGFAWAIILQEVTNGYMQITRKEMKIYYSNIRMEIHRLKNCSATE